MATTIPTSTSNHNTIPSLTTTNTNRKINITIRPATPTDLPHLSTIESSADQIFRPTPMHAISNCPPNPLSSYAERQRRGQIWVACFTAIGEDERSMMVDVPVGFVSIAILENSSTPEFRSIFIHQISTSPVYARQGIGRKLLEYVEEWARKGRFQAVDLTTFSEIPWNKAYYERMGYKVLNEVELRRENASGLRERKKEEERDEVLGQWAKERVCMRKILLQWRQ